MERRKFIKAWGENTGNGGGSTQLPTGMKWTCRFASLCGFFPFKNIGGGKDGKEGLEFPGILSWRTVWALILIAGLGYIRYEEVVLSGESCLFSHELPETADTFFLPIVSHSNTFSSESFALLSNFYRQCDMKITVPVKMLINVYKETLYKEKNVYRLIK